MASVSGLVSTGLYYAGKKAVALEMEDARKESTKMHIPGCIQQRMILTISGKDFPETPSDSLLCKKKMAEKLWHDFFSDPSQWWDHRPEKDNPRYPDFKHRKTQHALWVIDNANPPWVAAEVAAMAPGSIPSNIFAWNIRLARHSKACEYEKTMALFQKMEEEGIRPDRFTFVPVLTACAGLEALEEGKRIHTQIMQAGLESNVFVGSCLVDMYGKCRSMEDACRVFKKMPTRNVVSWSAMILGYVKCGQSLKALELYKQMCEEGVEPNNVTFLALLNACASVAALKEGQRVHQQIIRSGYESDVFVGSCLIDMYAKCGSIQDAFRVFDKMPTRNVVSWNALLRAYSSHGLAKEAITHLDRMCEYGVELNDVSLVSLLSVCSHAGLVDEGLHYFEALSGVYNIPLGVRHFACVVDVLGRAGRLHEAEDLIKSISYEADVSVWMSLLGACRVHMNVEMGGRVAKEVVKLDPENTSVFVLLSNIYATTGKWQSSASLQQKLLEGM